MIPIPDFLRFLIAIQAKNEVIPLESESGIAGVKDQPVSYGNILL